MFVTFDVRHGGQSPSLISCVMCQQVLERLQSFPESLRVKAGSGKHLQNYGCKGSCHSGYLMQLYHNAIDVGQILRCS